MSDKTHIEWTEATWNPVTGCSKVSSGCKHCYAERDWARLSANKATRYFGRAFTDVQCHTDVLDLPLRWTRPRRIFVNSMSDLFHPDVPFQFIADVFAVMSCTTRHTYQVLTKRPQRMLEFFAWLDEDLDGFGDPTRVDPLRVWPQWKAHHGRGGYDNCGPAWPLTNVWLGVSVEDQATAEERIPLLLQTPAAVRWISAEPLLGAVDIAPHLWGRAKPCTACTRDADCDCGFMARKEMPDEPAIDWVVVGGESGLNARPMHPDWARALRDQCAAAGVQFLFKQFGEYRPDYDRDREDPDWRRCALVERECQPGRWLNLAGGHGFNGERVVWASKVGKKRAGRLLDGVQHDGYPES